MILLLSQIAVVVFAARAAGRIVRALGQPQVVGEMTAGILLGPSLLGWLAPDLSAALFPPAGLSHLEAISQVGMVVFMFLVGLRLDPQHLRRSGTTAVVISQASIAAPFALGSALAVWLHASLAPAGVGLTGFALFMGAAMSITAFPVLARILVERDLLTTRTGTLALACAAVDDVAAWIILAIVVVIVRAGSAAVSIGTTLAGVAMFVGVMWILVRPQLRRLQAHLPEGGPVPRDVLAAVLLIALLSAVATEWIGIHALFGAFFAGAMMPKSATFVQTVNERLEDVTVVLLLPLFFALTGLRTSVGLLDGVGPWAMCATIVGVAVAGKFGGAALAARAAGVPWREAATVGALMNTRGLMELVILNVGLEIGVISPALFTMMVLMAIVTTAMTAPLLESPQPFPVQLRASVTCPDTNSW